MIYCYYLVYLTETNKLMTKINGFILEQKLKPLNTTTDSVIDASNFWEDRFGELNELSRSNSLVGKLFKKTSSSRKRFRDYQTTSVVQKKVTNDP